MYEAFAVLIADSVIRNRSKDETDDAVVDKGDGRGVDIFVL